MAKRYYICDLIGDGSMDNPYRPSVASAGVNHTTAYPPQNMTTGAYEGTRCLSLVATSDHTTVQLDLRNRVWPDYPLDVKISSMDAATRTAWEAMLTANGFTVNWSTSDGYRMAIRSVGRQLDANFHEDRFDVKE